MVHVLQDEEPGDAGFWTDDILGNLIQDEDLCELLNITPEDVVNEMEVLEALVVNFMYDHGAMADKVRNLNLFSLYECPVFSPCSHPKGCNTRANNK